MATCRTVALEALRALNALAPGEDMQVGEGAAALEAIQNLVLEQFEAAGPLIDVDVTADYVPGENERVRVQAGYTVTVTFPNAIATQSVLVNDYGFRAAAPVLGSTGIADGKVFRAPRDGARIEIVHATSGASPALYFFRADIDSWVSAQGLTLDGNLPFNAHYAGHFGALVAERLAGVWPDRFEPTPSLQRRIARANSAMMLRTGAQRSAVRGAYF